MASHEHGRSGAFRRNGGEGNVKLWSDGTCGVQSLKHFNNRGLRSAMIGGQIDKSYR